MDKCVVVDHHWSLRMPEKEGVIKYRIKGAILGDSPNWDKAKFFTEFGRQIMCTVEIFFLQKRRII